MDLEDIIMTDISSELRNMESVALSDNDMRSPRTPTWAPESPSSHISPFDYGKFFGNSPQISPRNSIPPPPDMPLPWVWQCHLCRHRYPLGVTRRCLYDGHYYCSGETDRPNLKKKRKGHPCSSEFDYDGWGDYGDWKRSVMSMMKNPRIFKGCEKCDFPSECRTPKSQMPVRKKKVQPPAVSLHQLRQELDIPTSSLVHVPLAESEQAIQEIQSNHTSKQGASKVRQSKVQELVKIMHDGRKTDWSEETKPEKILELGGIEGESARKDIAQDKPKLRMPVLDIWSKSSKS